MCAEAIVPMSICTLCLDCSLKISRNNEVIFVNQGTGYFTFSHCWSSNFCTCTWRMNSQLSQLLSDTKRNELTRETHNEVKVNTVSFTNANVSKWEMWTELKHSSQCAVHSHSFMGDAGAHKMVIFYKSPYFKK